MTNLFILPSDSIIDLDYVIAIAQEPLFNEISQVRFHKTSGSVVTFKTSLSDNAAKVKWEDSRQMKPGAMHSGGANQMAPED
jgi:hypothetical protein